MVHVNQETMVRNEDSQGKAEIEPIVEASASDSKRVADSWSVQWTIGKPHKQWDTKKHRQLWLE